MPTIAAVHLELCDFSSDKYYRLFADASGSRVHATFGARGARGQKGPTTVTGDPIRTMRALVGARVGRGYDKIVEIAFEVSDNDGALGPHELDAAFDAAWRIRDGAVITALTSAPPSAERGVVMLPHWTNRRGRGGHRDGRSWGPALKAALAKEPSAVHRQQTLLAVAPMPVVRWARDHYPSAKTTPVGPVADEQALLTLVNQMLESADLTTSVSVAQAALG